LLLAEPLDVTVTDGANPVIEVGTVTPVYVPGSAALMSFIAVRNAVCPAVVVKLFAAACAVDASAGATYAVNWMYTVPRRKLFVSLACEVTLAPDL